MAAEGRYDLMLAPSHDPDKLRKEASKADIGCASSPTTKTPMGGSDGKTKVRLMFSILLPEVD